MKHEELLVVAKELGIENADSLAYNDLKKAVSEAKKASEAINSANTQNTDENLDSEEKEPEIKELDTPITPDESGEHPDPEKDIKNMDNENHSNPDPSLPNPPEEKNNDVESVIKKALSVPEEVLTTSGEGNENDQLEEMKAYFEDDSGRKYVFSQFAPEKFRFNDQVKTQTEWLQDSDTMEQLVFGNCTYVEQIFNN